MGYGYITEIFATRSLFTHFGDAARNEPFAHIKNYVEPCYWMSGNKWNIAWFLLALRSDERGARSPASGISNMMSKKVHGVNLN